ncbi:carbamoyltransferase C-terminal domain-containing protein [Methylophaga sp.]|uniref:carbamoyltransferase C-terminal domain-containing protein n=1 Tax=Methylophaga sp. TaxID=2024840 RepID=UPI003A95420B
MIILGLHCGHNSSAALMKDGVIVGAVQEERFTKCKNQVAFPEKSIRNLVDAHLGGDISLLDHVAMFTKNVDPIGLAISRYSDFSVLDHINENKEYWKPVFYDSAVNDGKYWRDMYVNGEKLNQNQGLDTDYMKSSGSLEDLTRYVSDELRIATLRDKFRFGGPCSIYDHHYCHATYALYGSKLPQVIQGETLVLTADSWGDGQNWSAYLSDEQGRLNKIGGGKDHSVARVYRFVTLILGMKPNEHEYKVMGLSGYSRHSKYTRAVEDIFDEILTFENGIFVSPKPLKESYFDLKERLEGHRFDNIAFAVQNWATRVTGDWMKYWLEKTSSRNVCFSGGLSMNIKSNGDLLSLPEIDWMSVPASGGDESGSIGACFAAAIEEGETITPIKSAYLGHVNGVMGEEDKWQFGVQAANDDPDNYLELQNIEAKGLAKLLANNVIVARCVGPMEFGARALGNRSILANPSDVGNLKRINDAIKNRDFWMPFTPSILEEDTDLYLLNPKKVVSPFMTIGFETTDRAKRDLIAAVHPGDFSARPQFVSKEINPEYWELIHAFKEITDVPALLNTSLNLHGDPMNCSVADAARTLSLSALEVLALPGKKLLVKKDALEKVESIFEA